MKLTYDFLNILAKYRNRVENYDLDYSEENAIALIEKVGKRYERIAAEQRVEGYNRVRIHYEERMKKIKAMVEKATLFVFMLSERDDEATWEFINNLLDIEISGNDTDEIGGDLHAETTGHAADDR